MRTSVKLRTQGGLSAICLACALAGCTSTKYKGAQHPLELNESDLNQARALAHYCQGMILEDLEGLQSPDTFKHYSQAVELYPADRFVYPKVAYSLMMNKQVEGAIDFLDAATKRLPNRIEPYFHLANAYNYAGDPEKAIRNYLKILDLESDKTRIYIKIAMIYFDEGVDKKALAILDKGLSRANSPDVVRKYCYNRGLQFIEDEESNRSMACFRLVAKHSTSRRPEIYHLMGNLYENLKLNDEALQSYELACAEEKPLAQSYIRLAALRTRDDMTLAINTLKEAERILPDNVYILLALAQMHSIEEDPLSAMKIYARTSALVTEQADIEFNPSFYLYYGAACERAGYHADAEALFESCIQEYPDSHEVLNYLAYMWAEQGRHLEQALQYVGRALEQEPENGAYLDTRGWIHFRQGDNNKALLYIEKASHFYPRDATINDHLGDTWSALGDRDRAILHWTHSYVFDSENDAVAIKLEANGVDLALIESTSTTHKLPIIDSSIMPDAEAKHSQELSVSTPAREAPTLTRERLPTEKSPVIPSADF
jgi:tetratricopeptide (TPR) repeat protein